LDRTRKRLGKRKEKEYYLEMEDDTNRSKDNRDENKRNLPRKL
jgi:hypothetical protein